MARVEILESLKMTKKVKLKLLQRKLKKVHNFYSLSLEKRLELINSIKEFSPTMLSEFAAGYMAALHNVQKYGIKRISANAYSGISK